MIALLASHSEFDQDGEVDVRDHFGPPGDPAVRSLRRFLAMRPGLSGRVKHARQNRHRRRASAQAPSGAHRRRAKQLNW